MPGEIGGTSSLLGAAGLGHLLFWQLDHWHNGLGLGNGFSTGVPDGGDKGLSRTRRQRHSILAAATPNVRNFAPPEGKAHRFLDTKPLKI